MFTFTATNHALARALLGLDPWHRPFRVSAANPEADNYRRLLQDLADADRAIAEGRIDDAHEALIHAQDLVFDNQLAAGPGGHLDLGDRLVDANRAKDRTIIAECRTLIEPLVDLAAVESVPAPLVLTGSQV